MDNTVEEQKKYLHEDPSIEMIMYAGIVHLMTEDINQYIKSKFALMQEKYPNKDYPNQVFYIHAHTEEEQLKTGKYIDVLACVK